MDRSQYVLVLLAFASACLVGTQAANSHLNRHDSHNRRHNAPSQFILSSQIYDRYDRTSSNYRPDSFPWETIGDGQGKWNWYEHFVWTVSFYPSLLYLLNERADLCPGSTSIDWLSRARQWTTGIARFTSLPLRGYDLGLLSYPYVEELKINPSDQTAQQGIRKWGKMQAGQCYRKVGCTRTQPGDAVVVAIEDMMGLQLLFDAGNLDGISDYYDYASIHANTTSINHLREDGSSFQAVKYNVTNGNVIEKFTSEGYADSSTWSRGQAWGIYGFAMMYTRTRSDHFLEISREMGRLFLRRLSEDPSGVPRWDFDVPESDPKFLDKDTPAATIASVGFLELYQAELSKGNSTGADFWKRSAITLLSTTADAYFKTGQYESWEAILSDGTFNHSPGWGDSGLIYGDYYFVKAGNMLLQNGLIECPSR